MGRKTVDPVQQALRELDAGKRASEARNAQIDEWSAREKERIEQKYAAKRAVLAAARQQQPGAGGPSQRQAPEQLLPNVAPAQTHVPTRAAIPGQALAQQVQIQVQAPPPPQARPNRSPHEVLQGIKLSAICQRRLDDQSRRQQISQANKVGGPVPVFAPLPDPEEYVAALTRRAVERGEITSKEVKVEGHDDGCCTLM